MQSAGCPLCPACPDSPKYPWTHFGRPINALVSLARPFSRYSILTKGQGRVWSHANTNSFTKVWALAWRNMINHKKLRKGIRGSIMLLVLKYFMEIEKFRSTQETIAGPPRSTHGKPKSRQWPVTNSTTATTPSSKNGRLQNTFKVSFYTYN